MLQLLLKFNRVTNCSDVTIVTEVTKVTVVTGIVNDL